MSGFFNIDSISGEVDWGFFADVSSLKVSAKDVAKMIENRWCLEVRFSDRMHDGLIVDELFFPLMIGGERTFTFKVESFGTILRRLYEKFGTGAAVILHEMGMAMGESKVKIISKKYHADKLTALKIILAERSTKGWCRPEIAEFSIKSSAIIAYELFECLPFKGKQDNAVSQFFRGYLAGIFHQLYNKEVSVTEVECVAKGNSLCKFDVQVKE